MAFGGTSSAIAAAAQHSHTIPHTPTILLFGSGKDVLL
jgi:hypothetical protein